MSPKKKTGYPSKDRTHLKGITPSKLHPSIIPLNLLATFLLINSKTLHEPAIIDRGISHSGKQLRDDVVALIKALLLLGLQPENVLVIATPNLYEGIILTMAANAIGIKVAYLNDLASTEEIADGLNLHEADVLTVYMRDEAFAKEIYAKVPTLRTVINIGTYESSPGLISYHKLLVSAFRYKGSIRPILLKHLFSKKDAFYLQTSGSTSGRPKILPFSNENVFAALIYASNSTGTKTNDAEVKKVLCIMPYRLPYGWMPVFVNLLGGNLVELAPGGSEEQIAEYWKTGASYIYGTPLIFRVFMEKTPEDADLSFLKAFFCSGFSMSETWFQEGLAYLRRHNSSAEIRNNYGIGEALCIGTASDGIPHREGTSGKFYVGPEWVIVDDDLKEVRYNERGEVLLHSKSLCNGYFKDPEATKSAFIRFRGKKFYRSGDYVSLSEDGYVTFYGRKKRFYQPLGAIDKVNCETIEKALLRVPNMVKQCAVVIYSPDNISEASCAFIVPNPEYIANGRPEGKAYEDLRRELLAHLEDNLLNYQMPSRLVFLSELPMLESNKPDYVTLEHLAKK